MEGKGSSGAVVVTQVAVVVRDLEAAMRAYHRTFGWGPWRIYDLCEPLHHDTSVRGEPARYSMRTAVTQVGGLNFELVEPLEGQSPYKEFLEEKGEGLHHIMCQTAEGEDFDVAARLAECGLPVLMSGAVGDAATYAYHDGTSDGLKVIVETMVGRGHVAPSGVFTPDD